MDIEIGALFASRPPISFPFFKPYTEQDETKQGRKNLFGAPQVPRHPHRRHVPAS